jgi:hypothetical protein
MDTRLSSRALAGMWAGSQAISWSISGMGWVMEARYCLLQRPIWRSK